MSDLAWPVAPPALSWEVEKGEPFSTTLSEVWVAVIILTYQVSRKDIPVTQTLSSAAMLFAPRTDETMTTAKVVAAAKDEAECREALDAWKRANPHMGGEEIVTSVPFGRDRAAGAALPVGPAARCIDCGLPIGDGFRCDPCVKKFWQKLRDTDPDYATQTV
jgi:hypothetical protein